MLVAGASTIPLHLLAKSQQGRIVQINATDAEKYRLFSLGFFEGLHIRLLHEGPLGGDPIAVDIEGHMVALRRADAAHILVDIIE